MRRFARGTVILGCDQVLTGPGNQGVLDQVLEHAAADHGLVSHPLTFIELVMTYTRLFTPNRRRHLRLVGRAYRHECLWYDGSAELLDAVVPFVRDGPARSSPQWWSWPSRSPPASSFGPDQPHR